MQKGPRAGASKEGANSSGAKRANFKLATVSKALGIEVDDSKLHDAEYDILLTRQIYNLVTN